MNNVNMGGMNNMGGPVGGGMPMMNNGAAGARPPMMPANNDQKGRLNTYIYEYFLRNGMYDCARSLLNSEVPINVTKDSPGRRRDDNGNLGNGTEDGGDESKDDIDSKRPLDLPEPDLPKECPETCFLYEWWCLFWDMFNAQRGKGDARNVMNYVTHTQNQSRLRQEQQQAMLRGIRNGENMTGQQYQQMMMRGQANGMNLNPNEQLRKNAMLNQRNATPQMQMLAQQKQQQMQRDPSEGGNQQRPQSPGSAENAPSPSKRPRLDGTPFNPQSMPNGRQGGGIPQQFQNMPGGQNPNTQQQLAGYQQGLARQQNNQMAAVKAMPTGGPANQGSPMMNQGQDGGAIANYYNPGEMGPNGMRGGPGGAPGGGGGNHALQDYQMQLMLLEQQNKKRLMMARQEQDNMMPRPDGAQGAPGAAGPNGQPFQGTSPQGRSVNSPNPGDQMKRGTPHMNNAGMPSPIPEGQSRSPGGGMNFNIPGNPMDPNMNAPYFKMGNNGMDPNMAGAMPNGMRPPSSHPGGFPNPNQMTPQQMAMARQQQMQQGAAVQNWQNGPNGQMMPQATQGAPPQSMGTPQQRAMPPPSAPAVGATNGRTQPPSPQQNAAPPTPSQTNKANPKKKAESKDSKAKRATKKGTAANLNAGATPSADAETAAATPTPATPITPVHPNSFKNGQNGAVQQPVTNGAPAAPPANAGVVAQQPDPLQGNGFIGDNSFAFGDSMDFANPGTGNMDVLQDFDFDSFLHQDGEGVDNFNFDTSAFLDTDGIGAE